MEGKIQLELDKYESALCKSKPNNPSSLGYQLVKTAFPESYIKNVTIGKKFLTENELAKFRDNFRDEKVPLVYAWSFKDPFSEPFRGSFEFHLGRKRIKSLIGENRFDSFQ